MYKVCFLPLLFNQLATLTKQRFIAIVKVTTKLFRVQFTYRDCELATQFVTMGSQDH